MTDISYIIEKRQEEIKQLERLQNQIEILDLDKKTLDYITAKISSKIAQAEISIRDHS